MDKTVPSPKELWFRRWGGGVCEQVVATKGDKCNRNKKTKGVLKAGRRDSPGAGKLGKEFQRGRC